MLVGKQMQFFGARSNIAKCLFGTLSTAVVTKSAASRSGPVTNRFREYLELEDVIVRFEKMMDWLAASTSAP